MGWAGWLTGGWEFMGESEELLDDAIGSLACIPKPGPHACTATPSPLRASRGARAGGTHRATAQFTALGESSVSCVRGLGSALKREKGGGAGVGATDGTMWTKGSYAYRRVASSSGRGAATYI